MPNKKYTSEDLAAALKNVNDNKLSIYKAARTYNVPEQTIRNKVKQLYTKQDAPGKPTVLTATEEALLVKWVQQLADAGFPITKVQLIFSVAKLVKQLGRENTFKNGIPGKYWYSAFLSRNPAISERAAQILTTARVGATEDKIRAWFERVRAYLEQHNSLDILQDPSRIFNCDESAFFLCPKGLGVLTRKGSKNVYVYSGNNEKENITLSLGASASGKLMPIFALFPYKRMPTNILAKYPKTWAFGKSDNGWMTCETFYEYIVNVFHPFLIKEKIQLPIILFIDGHSSHLSLALSEFCKANGIILIALLPNSTHILQPMDVAVFHPLKVAWKNKVQQYRMDSGGNRLLREDFAPLLEKCLDVVTAETVQHGFKACGLYPFNPDAPSYHRLNKSKNDSTADLAEAAQTDTPFSKTTVDMQLLQKCNKYAGAEKVAAFEKCKNGVWSGDVKDENLFNFWRTLQGNLETEVVTVEDDFNFGNSTLVANDILDPSAELHASDLADIDNNSFAEFLVQPDGTMITSTPHGCHASDLADIDNNSFAEFLVQPDGTMITSTPHGCPSSTVTEEVQMAPTPDETDPPAAKNENTVATATCVPEKTVLENPVNAQFPSPFKNALLWPGMPKSVQPRKVRRIIPTVAIAEEFMEHQRRTEEAKKEKIEKTLEKKRKKEEKKETQTKEKKVKETSKKGRKIGVGENSAPNSQTTSLDSIAIDDFVLIVYEEEKFPGVVQKILGAETCKLKYEVSTMQMIGKNWRWPEKKDVLEYDAVDVLRKLKPPKICNNRGVYAFSDI